MIRPCQISRRFGVLTLLLALPLGAALAYVGYDRYLGNDDGWQTFRNGRYGYEVRYPPGWIIDDDHGGELRPGLEMRFTSFRHPRVPTPDLARPPSVKDPLPVYPINAVAWLNPQGDWCLQRTEKTEVVVSRVMGTEYVSYWYGANLERCQPQPGCREQPLGLMRDFERDG